VFGEVTEGLDVIDRIATVATDRYDRPYEDVMIVSVKQIGLPEPEMQADTTATQTDTAKAE
jgi:cyclophilin family peptidyl-prolyl cis-trans isomerase